MCVCAEVADAAFLVRFDMEVGLFLDMVLGMVVGVFWGLFLGLLWACFGIALGLALGRSRWRFVGSVWATIVAMRCVCRGYT